MNNGKLVAAIILFTVAGLFTYSAYRPDSPEQSLAQARTAWKCAQCDNRVDLASDEVKARFEAANFAVPLTCAACTQRQLYTVLACPVCSTEYFGSEVPGHTGKCPVCDPDADAYVPQVVEAGGKRRVVHQN